MARSLLATPVLLMAAVLAVSGQPHVDELRTQVASRFVVLPIANGIVLTPRFKTSIKSIEVSESAIAVDGAPVTGRELREQLGNDAEIVLQVSYLDNAARADLARSQTPKPAERTSPPPTLPGADSDRARFPEEPRSPRSRRRDEIVRIGGSVTVPADESVRGDVVVVGGSARIEGEVDGEVVVVGGSAQFGPQADVRGDVTVVGGGLFRHESAIIRGGVHEVGLGGVPWRGNWSRHGDWDWWDGFDPVLRLFGTTVRVTLLILLTALVLFLARAPVEQIADRVAADPLKSWFVGFLAEMLFLPVLVMTVVVLAISIIGIPLLLLVPVALVALIVVMLVGFTAVAYQVGRMLQDRVEGLRTRPYAATILGILLIVSPVLLARFIGFTGMGMLMWPIAAIGFLFEYSAWTAGLGAAALVRFAKPAQPPAATTSAIVG